MNTWRAIEKLRRTRTQNSNLKPEARKSSGIINKTDHCNLLRAAQKGNPFDSGKNSDIILYDFTFEMISSLPCFELRNKTVIIIISN